MGHHAVPQRYLRGFQCGERPDFIWTYDKQAGTLKCLPIRQVVQSPAFYSDEVEKELNEHVEQPGNDVIDKIRRGERTNETDRRHLTYYMATMIRRVPHARSKAEKMLPTVLADTVRKARDLFEHAAREGRIDAETLAARLAEVDSVERRFKSHPPVEVLKAINTPWPYARMLLAVYSMTWRLFRSTGPSYFLTSDNPVYFFEADG